MGKVADLVAPLKKAPGLHYKNPRFPLTVKLPHNLQAGTKIHIHGAIYMTAERFAFNLKDAELDANNYFHFNPRFDENCIVRNSRIDESWGDEERDGDMPLEPGQTFLITITSTEECYEVEVNGAHFCNFFHRDGAPFSNVSHIAVWGDVTIYGIHVPANSMPVPMSLRIPKHAFLGDIFVIEGHIPGGADRFLVNVQAGEQENADILYHFNPRFHDNVLVCNNRASDCWGDEERMETLPVGPGDNFVLCIVAGKEGYIPFLNGNPMPIFGHRLNLSGACILYIEGDVEVKNLSLDSAPVRMPPRVPDIDIENFEETTVQSLRTQLPVTLPLLDNFAPCKAIYFSGKVDADPTRFAINLQCGASPDDEIALHLNPRWDDDEGSVLVINTRDENSWGEEIRVPNPIVPGEEVDVFIIGSFEGYSILINGEIATEVEHRLDISKVNHVNLDGCITLHRMLSN